MRAELLCSCGLLLEHAGSRILIDAPNGTIPPFYEFPDAEMQKLLDGTGVYSGLCGVFFTHLHPDHYDEARVNALLRRRGALTTFLPDKQMPETITRTAGPFTVECRRFPHMPAPKFPDVAHYVLLVTAGGRSVYITADAVPDAAAHRAVLHARRPQLAFWNSQSLSYPDMRALLREETEQSAIYHMPVDPADQSGIRRKSKRNMQRYGAELPNVRVLTQYPSELNV